MRVKSNLIGLICFVLFFSMPVFAQTNLSVQELKEQYNLYDKIANDPDIFWIPTFEDKRDEDYNHSDEDGDDSGMFVNREGFEKYIEEKVIYAGNIPLQEIMKVKLHHINLSQGVKANLRSNLLPDLEKIIKKRQNSVNPNYNYYEGTWHEPTASTDFDNILENMTSDEHLDSLNFDKILAASNGTGTSGASGTGTAIQNTQIDSFDGNWSDAINDNYSSCPKTKPDDRLSFRAYPNGQTSGNTYRYCVYFGNGYLKREEPYVNGKLDGLKTSYIWSDEYNVPYHSTRENHSNGKRDGLFETYLMSRKGVVYRMELATYSDGMLHGDGTQWYENGQTRTNIKYLQGKVVLQHNYREDGTFLYCTKWDADRTVRDCITGKRR